MSVFTDDDLRLLKDSISTWDCDIELDAVLLAGKLESLLTRLEAAEAYASRFDPIDDADIDCLSAWKKSKGA